MKNYFETKPARGILALLFIAACMVFVNADAAEKYPSRPIKIVVPYGAGGTGDTFARVLGKQIESTLNQPVIVEDRPGAGGNIGAAYAAKADPDGYTLFMAGNSFSGNLSLFKHPPYALSDFAPIMLIAVNPYIVVANPEFPVSNISQLIAYAKAHPNAVNFGSAGVGGGQHLSGELMNSMAGITMTHVPYNSATKMLTELIGKDIQIGFSSMVAALPLVQSGKLKALAVTTPARSKALPNVPTVAESGLPGYDMHGWYGVFVPAGTPAPVVNKLNKVFADALKDPQTAKLLEVGGNELIGGTPGEFETFVEKDVQKDAKLIKSAGVKPQ